MEVAAMVEALVRSGPGRQAEVKLPSWRTDKRKTAERGYGGRWQRARLRFLGNNPLCVMCEQRGRVEVATVVDHIVPHRGDQELFWSEDNWQSLCSEHHNGEKQRLEKSGRVIAQINEDGWPV